MAYDGVTAFLAAGLAFLLVIVAAALMAGRLRRAAAWSRARLCEPRSEAALASVSAQSAGDLRRLAPLPHRCDPMLFADGLPFVWPVVGAIANATKRLRLGTGVTCPTIRIHPAIVAQAAATAAALMPGRFFLGVGSGENLNKHVVGERWPPLAVRLEMLEEAIEAIQELWTGKLVSHRGKHYTIENARLYTLPDEPPPLVVAAAGPNAAELAGKMGDGLIGVSPQAEVLDAFEAAGGAGKPRYGQVQVCWAADEESAKQTALEWFPNIALPGDLSQELPQPADFEQASELLSEDEMAEIVACGPDPERHLEMIGRFHEAGFDHVYVHQIGPDQEVLMDFYRREVLPRVSERAGAGCDQPPAPKGPVS